MAQLNQLAPRCRCPYAMSSDCVVLVNNCNAKNIMIY